MPPEQDIVDRWLDTETKRLLETVKTFQNRDLKEPSTLPDWSLAQLLTHVARNADALCNLLKWAKTGIETPMYTSSEQRNDDINRGQLRRAELIVDDVAATARKFEAAMCLLTQADWQRPVRTAQGRTIPAAEITWLRLREVTVHHVDLGARFEDLPPDVVLALLNDVTATLRTKEQWPLLSLEATDCAFATPDGDQVVKGTSVQLLGWLTGRSDADGLVMSSGPIPRLPAWL